MTRPALLSAFTAACLIAATPALGDDFAAIAEAELASFEPISEATLDDARGALADASSALASAWRSLPDQGESWRRYLSWEDVESITESRGADVDLAALQTAYAQLNSGAPGLELPVFRDASRSVRRLRDLATMARSRDQRTAYQRQLQAVQQLLQMDVQVTDPRVGYQLERRLDLLAGVSESPQLAAAIKQEFDEPNLLLTLSEPLINRLVRRPVTSREPIRDTILGARVVGTGDTSAWLSVTTEPARENAHLVFSLNGSIHSETTGYTGPIAVRSSAETPINAHKAVRLSPETFLLAPADASATTHSRTRSILKKSGRAASGLIKRIASNRVTKERPQADRIASRKAEDRVARSFDDQVNNAIRDLRRQYDDNWTKPLARYGATPVGFRLSTTDTTFEGELLQADRGQLGAPSPAPTPPKADAVVRVHTSAVHNLGTTLLGGATIEKTDATKPPSLSVVLPAWLDRLIPKETEPDLGEDAPPFRPWSIKLRSVRPLSVEVVDGGFVLHVHTAEILSGGSSYRGWEISLEYAPVLADGSWRLERRGEIGVLPSSFDPKSGKSLKGREVALRRNLAKALNDAAEAGYGVPNFMQLAPIDLTGLDQPGVTSLVVRDVVIADNWLTISWDAS